MTSQINTTPRLKISADRVYFEMTSRLPIVPPMTFCEEVAERANRYATSEIWIADGGVLVTLSPDGSIAGFRTFMGTNHKLVDMQGLVEGEWSEELIKACVAGCSVYGILGLP